MMMMVMMMMMMIYALPITEEYNTEIHSDVLESAIEAGKRFKPLLTAVLFVIKQIIIIK